MFIRLTYHEVKKLLKSITFYMFLIIISFNYMTQYIPPTSYDPLRPIPSNLKNDGTSSVIANELNEMTLVYYRINYNLENGVFARYIFGIKRCKKLDIAQKKFLGQVKSRLYGDSLNPDGTPDILISYDKFKEIIESLDKKLGGNTVYSERYIENLFWEILYGHKTLDNPDLRTKAGYLEMSTLLTMNEYLKIGPIINWYKPLSKDQRTSIDKAMKSISLKGIDENGSLTDPVSYQEYESIIDKLDADLNDTTIFSKKHRDMLYVENMTYKDAMMEFDEILNNDKLTNAYGRYFSDYMGITAGLYPLFIVMAVFLRDRKKGDVPLLNNKELSPRSYILSRYCAICISILAGYLLLATHSTYVFYNIGKSFNYLIDFGAFYKYTLTWIAPTVLFTVACSMLLFTIFNRILPTIVIQTSLWFFSMQTLGGDYRLLRSIIRFNTLGNHETYLQWKSTIMTNRIFFTTLSFMIIAITVFLYNYRISKITEDTP